MASIQAVASVTAKDIQIVYSNVGIDVWNTGIDIDDAVSDYPTLVGQLNDRRRGNKQAFFNHTLLIPDPRDRRYKVNYLEKNRKCIGVIENRLRRNMCENGCLAIYPPVVTVMNEHFKNAMDVSKKADLILLNEMCRDKAVQVPGTQLCRIKRKDRTFRARPEWVDKIDLVAAGANLSGSESFYFDDADAIKVAPASLDENTLSDKELGLAYNANLSRHVLPNGETLLIWFVHWPVLTKRYIFDEVSKIMENIEKLLLAGPCNFLAIGDFNTNARENDNFFRTIGAKLKRTQAFTTYAGFSGNDGYIACLNPKTFADVTVNYDILGKAQPFSAHVPMGLTLQAVPPPSPPKVIKPPSPPLVIKPPSPSSSSALPLPELSAPPLDPSVSVQVSPKPLASLPPPSSLPPSSLPPSLSSLSSVSVGPSPKPIAKSPMPIRKPIAKTPIAPKVGNRMVEVRKADALRLLTARNKDGFNPLIIDTLANNFNTKSKIKSIYEDDFAASIYTQLKQLLRFDKANKLSPEEIEALKPQLDELITTVLGDLKGEMVGGFLESYSQNKKDYLRLHSLV